jgi:hypothetical protein
VRLAARCVLDLLWPGSRRYVQSESLKARERSSRPFSTPRLQVRYLERLWKAKSRATMMNNVLTLRPRPRPLRADVPTFDPTNDKHLRAWESMWDAGQYWLRQQGGRA